VSNQNLPQDFFCGSISTNSCRSTRQQADAAISALQGFSFFGKNLIANWPTHSSNQSDQQETPKESSGEIAKQRAIPVDLREALNSPAEASAADADEATKRARVDTGAAASLAGAAVVSPAAKRQNTGGGGGPARIVVVEVTAEAASAQATTTSAPAPVEAVEDADEGNATRGGKGGRGRGGRGRGRGRGKAQS
jgi:hypothetical protein